MKAEIDFNKLLDFVRSIFDGAIKVWEFLTTEITIFEWSFTPLSILVTIIGVLLIAWFIKKLVPSA